MIQKYEFGRMRVGGEEYVKDLKIIRGEVIANWRRKRGHLLERDDVQDILLAEPTILVVGTGYSGQMRIEKSLDRLLAELQIQLIVERTAKAAEVFNGLLNKGREVSGAFHLTC